MADLLAEFVDAESLLGAIEKLREAGLRDLEAFTPFEVREVQEALALPRPRISLYCLLGGIVGAAGSFLLQWWLNGILYPLNVGGRPLDSFPAFIPITFEGTVFGAAFGTVVAFLITCGLPRLWHPVFEVEGFERASIDRFFLRVGGMQTGADEARASILLREARALRTSEVSR